MEWIEKLELWDGRKEGTNDAESALVACRLDHRAKSLSIRNVVVFVSEKREKAESDEAIVVPHFLHPLPRIVDPSRAERSDGGTSVSDRLSGDLH